MGILPTSVPNPHSHGLGVPNVSWSDTNQLQNVLAGQLVKSRDLFLTGVKSTYSWTSVIWLTDSLCPIKTQFYIPFKEDLKGLRKGF